MRHIREGQSIDECIARGCGGYLRAVGTTVGDGEAAYCMRCHREHTFHVFGDDEATASVGVSIERARRRRAHAEKRS